MSNEGPRPSPRRDNSEIVKLIFLKKLKTFFLRTTGPISTKLYTNDPWVKEIQVCANEGPCLSSRSNNSEIVHLYLI